MGVEKRNALARQSAMCVPLALDELSMAMHRIEEGKSKEALTCVREARVHLDYLRVVFDEACAEMEADEAGKQEKTPEEIAEDEARTNPMGLFNTAEAYRLSAVALEAADVKIGFAHSPIRFLYYHTIELYLKAFLRQSGHTVEELSDGKKFGHKTHRMVGRAEKLGLSFSDQARNEVFAIMGNTDAVIRARYIRTGPVKWPSLEALNRTCEELRRDVGTALVKGGVRLRL